MFSPIVFAVTDIKLQDPMTILGAQPRNEYVFQKALGIPFLMHTVQMVICILCIIKISLAIVRLEYLRAPQERVPVKNSIRASLIGIVIVGIMPLLGETVLGIIYATMM